MFPAAPSGANKLTKEYEVTLQRVKTCRESNEHLKSWCLFNLKQLLLSNSIIFIRN